jgi:hypothetical protein
MVLQRSKRVWLWLLVFICGPLWLPLFSCSSVSYLSGPLRLPVAPCGSVSYLCGSLWLTVPPCASASSNPRHPCSVSRGRGCGCLCSSVAPWGSLWISVAPCGSVSYLRGSLWLPVAPCASASGIPRRPCSVPGGRGCCTPVFIYGPMWLPAVLCLICVAPLWQHTHS